MCIHLANTTCAACTGQAMICQSGLNNYPTLAQQIGHAQQGIGPGFIPFPSQEAKDFELFKKYAHLTDAELMETYLDEEKAIKDTKENMIQMAINHAEIISNVHKEQFSEWCAKYRKNITIERINNLKAFI